MKQPQVPQRRLQKKPPRTRVWVRKPKSARVRRPDAIMKLPDGAEPKPALTADVTLKRLSAEMTQAMFAFMDVAEQVIDQKLYTALHYQTPEEYFGQRIGFAYRSLVRRLSIVKAVRAVPEREQDACRYALMELGIHRAAVLAPLLNAEADSWRTVIRDARRYDEDALQEVVTKRLGLKRRGRRAHEREGGYVGSAGDVAIERIIALMPQDAQEAARATFAKVGTACGADVQDKVDHAAYTLMWLLRDAEAGGLLQDDTPREPNTEAS